MRIIARVFFGVTLVLVLTGSALYFLRKPIAGAAVERVMARAGLEQPNVSVRDVNFSDLLLSEMKAGSDANAPEVYLRDVEFGFDLFDLLLRGKLFSAEIGSGDVTVVADAPGAISIAGWSPGGSSSPASQPVKVVSVKNIALRIVTPKGDAQATIDGSLDFDAGGRFEIIARAEKAGFPLASISALEGGAVIELAANGGTKIDVAVKSDFDTPAGVARSVDASANAEFASWKAFMSGGEPFEGVARLLVNSSKINTELTDGITPLIGVDGGAGAPVELSGLLEADFGRDKIVVSAPNGPVTFYVEGGGRLEVAGDNGNLFERRGAEKRLAMRVDANGPTLNASGVLDATSGGGDAWDVNAQVKFDERIVLGALLSGFSGEFEGVYEAGRLIGSADFDTLMKTVTIGRLRTFDAPVRGSLETEVNFKGRKFSGALKAGECLDVARAQFNFFDQDMDARANAAKICSIEPQFISVDWGDNPLTRIEGVLTAKTAYYRLGKTIFDGAPPQIDFKLDYQPNLQKSRITGDLGGGNVILNNALILSGAAGEFEADFIRDTVAGKVNLRAMRIAQNASLEQIAPVSVSGVATLADDIANFDFAVSTPKGAALGRGEGLHNVKTGDGEAVFDSGILTLSRFLRAEALIPALTGVVSETTGETEGRARVSWTPRALQSSATMSFSDVTFRGPGVAVTRTEGVDGKLVLSNLAPLTTASEQTISIRKIDMDALKLENGVVTFAFPGDETMRVVKAEFPWFNGTIGAYDSVIALSGGKAEVVLQIDNVDLGGLLSYPNVEGLSGKGVIEGVLPISFEGGRARIVNGVLSAKGGGVIRYQNKAAEPAFNSNEQAQLAYEILREVKFDNLSVVIDGPLDGTLDFKILFDGRGDIPVTTRGGKTSVLSPIIFRLTMNVPLLKLLQGAKVVTNPIEALKTAPKSAEDQEKAVDDLIGDNPDIF